MTKTEIDELNEGLERCIDRILDYANNVGDVATLSFPAISTNIYGFSKERSAKIYYDTCIKWFKKEREVTNLKNIRICICHKYTAQRFQEILA